MRAKNGSLLYSLSISWVSYLLSIQSLFCTSHEIYIWLVYALYFVVVRYKLILPILRWRHNGRHFPDDIFNCIFLNENVWISIKIALKFVPKGPINNIPALVQIMAWCRSGDKPLSEPLMIILLTYLSLGLSGLTHWPLGNFNKYSDK